MGTMSVKLVVIEWNDQELLAYRSSNMFRDLVALASVDSREQVAFAWPSTWELMCLEVGVEA